METVTNTFMRKQRGLSDDIRDTIWNWEQANPGKKVTKVVYECDPEGVDPSAHFNIKIYEDAGSVVPSTGDAPAALLRRVLEAKGYPDNVIDEALKIQEKLLNGELQETDSPEQETP